MWLSLLVIELNQFEVHSFVWLSGIFIEAVQAVKQLEIQNKN